MASETFSLGWGEADLARFDAVSPIHHSRSPSSSRSPNTRTEFELSAEQIKQWSQSEAAHAELGGWLAEETGADTRKFLDDARSLAVAKLVADAREIPLPVSLVTPRATPRGAFAFSPRLSLVRWPPLAVLSLPFFFFFSSLPISLCSSCYNVFLERRWQCKQARVELGEHGIALVAHGPPRGLVGFGRLCRAPQFA